MTKPSHSIDLSRVRLVNREYYDAIDAAMAKLPEPTVGDAINAMYAQGSEAYFKAFDYLDDDAIQKPFLPNNARHEISHLAARAGHTPQMELIELAFELGFQSGSDARHFSAEKYKQSREKSEDTFIVNAKKYTDRASEPLSKRDWAIYTAAGMYLRDKFDHLRHGSAWREPYAIQQQFCERYADTDASPIALNEVHSALGRSLNYAELFHDAPYALLKISDAEWRAIEGVALGLCTPKETIYPKRLAPIREALVRLGVDYNLREKLQAQEAAKGKE